MKGVVELAVKMVRDDGRGRGRGGMTNFPSPPLPGIAFPTMDDLRYNEELSESMHSSRRRLAHPTLIPDPSMDILPMPYIQRPSEEGRLRDFLRNGLNPTRDYPKALVLCGWERVGKRTLLRRVIANDPDFRKFSIGAQTHEILHPDGPSVAANAGEKAVELTPAALGMVHPLLGWVAEAARLLGKDYLSRPRGADLVLDYSILERIEKPVLVVVPRIDPSNVDEIEDAARLIREASVRNTPISLVFLDHSAFPRLADARAGESSTTTASGSAAGLRRFLPDDRQVTEVGVRPLAEAQVRQTFARLGLAPDWAALFYNFSEGQPASLAALWESLQRRGLLRRESDRRWKAEGPAVAGAAWGAIRDRLIDLIRTRPATLRQHEDRLINALHLAAAMGDTFLPVAVSEAVLAADPKRHAIDAEAWEDAWLDFLEFENADHTMLAAPVTLKGHPIELKADDRRVFVYRFRDQAIVHLLSAALRRFWRGGADTRDPYPAPDPGTLLSAVDRLVEWLAGHFRTAWQNGLAYRASLHRIQNQHADARTLEELGYVYGLAASLADRIVRARSRVHAGWDAWELYSLLSWASETWGRVGDYRQQLECLTESFHLCQAGQVTLSALDATSLSHDLGLALMENGRPAEAMPFFEQVLEVLEPLLGPEHPNTLSTVLNLGGALLALGRPADAEPYIRRSGEARERVLGPDHPATLSSIHSLGVVLIKLGRPADAGVYLRRALETRERVLGPEHPETLLSMRNLGLALKALGHPIDAKPYLQRALETSERVLGPEHPATLSSVHALGSVLLDLGHPADAEPFLRRALKARERVLGPKHPDTLLSVEVLGGVLCELGRFADAEPYFRRAVENNERVLGPEHPNSLNSVDNLGALLLELGQPADAGHHLRRALETCERVLGPEHAQTLTLAHRLGTVLHALGRPEEALRHFRQAFEGWESVHGPNHPNSQLAQEWIERICRYS